MERKKITIGRIVNTRGLKGKVKVLPMVDDLDLFESIEYVMIDGKKFEMEGTKYFKGNAILKLSGIDTIEEAENYKTKKIDIFEEDLPALEEGVYYVKDLLGLTVETEEGEKLGKIIDVFKTGSNDVYTVKQADGKEIYLPAIKDVVQKIDLKEKKVTVKLIEGLL